MATPSAPRPYRDYLIPRLHERFSKTALYTLPACYLAAISMSSWGSTLNPSHLEEESTDVYSSFYVAASWIDRNTGIVEFGFGFDGLDSAHLERTS